MKIKKLNTFRYKKSTPCFKAKDFATVITMADKTKETLRLFELEYSDSVFLDKMSSNLNLKKLFETKTYTDKQISCWKNIINNAILMSGFSNPEKAYLIANKSKPCGIISFQNLPQKEIYLDNLATWPVTKDNKVRFAGKVLVNAMFNDAQNNNVKHISLDLCNYLKDLSLKFYESLGFNNSQRQKNTLSITSTEYKERLEYLKKSIQIEENPHKPQVNLEKVLDIKFC